MARQMIGHYKHSEAPRTPLQYQFLDADGYPADLTGYTSAAFLTRPPSRNDRIASATIVSPATGVVSVEWTTAMTDEAGRWSGEFWLDSSLASDTLVWTVTDGPGPTVGV